MRLTDYVNASAEMKKRYFDTLSTQVGLRYYGGKAKIGKFIINRIFEMQAYRYMHNNPAKTFVDCFTGGGKIALTIPTGWFDTIVINDINYGVYSYYMCCRNNPLALIDMIEKLGKVMDYNMFRMFARERSLRGKNLPDDLLNELGVNRETLNIVDDGTVKVDADMVLSGAMTYWVTASSWQGETDPDKIFYGLDMSGKNEKEEIEKRVIAAKKRIMQINSKMNKQNYIIENMDYVDLIRKYLDTENESVIWYMDPPYHEATLNKSNERSNGNKSNPAPYEDSFHYEQTMAMTYLLATMKWFIKSDYDPVMFFRDPYEELDPKDPRNEKLTPSDHYHDFDIIENLDRGFVREYLGRFPKATITGTDTGHEVIWTRYDGSTSKEFFKHMGVGAVERNFWEHKKITRENWLYVKSKIEEAINKGKMLGIDDEKMEQYKVKAINKHNKLKL